MSAINSATLDTLVSVKVVYEGNTRRFKLGLKDVGPSMFQDKIRELLAIPDTQPLKFERYSDSAGRHITLDPENAAVYKQLFRAAKAKLRLRIKVTPIDDGIPKPSSPNFLPPSYSSVHLAQPLNAARIDALSQFTAPVPTIKIDEAVSKAVTDYCTGLEFATQLRDTVRDEIEKQSPKTPTLQEPVVPEKSAGPVDQPTATQDSNSALNYHRIYCDVCNLLIKGLHYHCSLCDGNDYDICGGCAQAGNRCKDPSHTLEKRQSPEPTDPRICNCCVGWYGDTDCVVCKDCKDFDLCIRCLQAGQHGHDPRHEFVRADESVSLKPEDQALLAKGRNTNHAALCDSCDKSILGIRYKCIDCPDWDYCNDCIGASRQTHPGHRFVSVLDNQSIWPQCSFKMFNTVSHYGVYCDGPICQKNGRDGGCIQGVRYKCAICPDTDFCASCEASPMNKHNHTHPLIKLKIPIRNVLVTTTDEKDTVMGDIPNTSSEPKRPTVATSTSNTATQVQTIADVKPTEDDPAPVEQKVSVKENPLFFNDNEPVSLGARFVIEVVADGTVMNVGERFTQTWYMKNSGKAAWPAGVTVQFVAGDYMFLKSDEDSLDATVTDSEVQPGEIVGFSVGLTPTWPPNKYYTSYWRLTAPDGRRFGENIWCCINVKEPEPVKSKKVEEEATQIRQEESIEEEFKETSEHNDDSKDNSKDLNDGPEADKDSDTFSSQSVADMDSIRDDKEEFETVAENLVKSQASSEMVFPKLPVESPIHSLEHLPSSSTSDNSGVIIPPSPASSSSHKTFALSEDGDIEEEAEISSLDGFMTDEEYDVLDASDEEFERVA